MKVSYFSDEAYGDLYAKISNNTSKYYQDEDWLDEYFKGREYKFESTIDFSLPELYSFPDPLTDENKTDEDIANVRIIYGQLKKLSPLQATNKYMWACLAHTVYCKYVQHRWNDGKLSENEKITRIRRRFFAVAALLI